MPETQELQEATEVYVALGRLETTGGYYSETTARMQKIAAVTFSQDEKVLKLEFLRDNELFYNTRLMDYKDPMKREVLWNDDCAQHGMDKNICKHWFQSQRTVRGRFTHMRSVHERLFIESKFQREVQDNK